MLQMTLNNAAILHFICMEQLQTYEALCKLAEQHQPRQPSSAGGGSGSATGVLGLDPLSSEGEFKSCKSSPPPLMIPPPASDSLALVVDEVPALLHESEGSSSESSSEASDDPKADDAGGDIEWGPFASGNTWGV